jgi:hypothetical protein
LDHTQFSGKVKGISETTAAGQNFGRSAHQGDESGTALQRT